MCSNPETPARRNVLGLRRGARGRWGRRAGRPTGGRRNRPTARGTLETALYHAPSDASFVVNIKFYCN